MSSALSTLTPSTPMPAARRTKSNSGSGQIHLLIGMLRAGREVLPPDVRIVLEDAVFAVRQDHEHDCELVVSGGPQRLDRVHRGAVAGDRDDRTVRHRDLDADRAGQPLADAAAATAEIIAKTAIVERAREIEARRDAFVHDHDILGQAAPKLGRDARHRGWLAVPALFKSRPIILLLPRAQVGEISIAALRGGFVFRRSRANAERCPAHQGSPPSRRRRPRRAGG